MSVGTARGGVEGRGRQTVYDGRPGKLVGPVETGEIRRVSDICPLQNWYSPRHCTSPGTRTANFKNYFSQLYFE